MGTCASSPSPVPPPLPRRSGGWHHAKQRRPADMNPLRHHAAAATAAATAATPVAPAPAAARDWHRLPRFRPPRPSSGCSAPSCPADCRCAASSAAPPTDSSATGDTPECSAAAPAAAGTADAVLVSLAGGTFAVDPAAWPAEELPGFYGAADGGGASGEEAGHADRRRAAGLGGCSTEPRGAEGGGGPRGPAFTARAVLVDREILTYIAAAAGSDLKSSDGAPTPPGSFAAYVHDSLRGGGAPGGGA